MSAYSDAQIAQLIADHAALKDEVAALKIKYRRLMGHHRYVCCCDLASDAAMAEIDSA